MITFREGCSPEVFMRHEGFKECISRNNASVIAYASTKYYKPAMPNFRAVGAERKHFMSLMLVALDKEGEITQIVSNTCMVGELNQTINKLKRPWEQRAIDFYPRFRNFDPACRPTSHSDFVKHYNNSMMYFASIVEMANRAYRILRVTKAMSVEDALSDALGYGMSTLRNVCKVGITELEYAKDVMLGLVPLSSIEFFYRYDLISRVVYGPVVMTELCKYCEYQDPYYVKTPGTIALLEQLGCSRPKSPLYANRHPPVPDNMGAHTVVVKKGNRYDPRRPAHALTLLFPGFEAINARTNEKNSGTLFKYHRFLTHLLLFKGIDNDSRDGFVVNVPTIGNTITWDKDGPGDAKHIVFEFESEEARDKYFTGHHTFLEMYSALGDVNMAKCKVNVPRITAIQAAVIMRLFANHIGTKISEATQALIQASDSLTFSCRIKQFK